MNELNIKTEQIKNQFLAVCERLVLDEYAKYVYFKKLQKRYMTGDLYGIFGDVDRETVRKGLKKIQRAVCGSIAQRIMIDGGCRRMQDDSPIHWRDADNWEFVDGKAVHKNQF